MQQTAIWPAGRLAEKFLYWSAGIGAVLSCTVLLSCTGKSPRPDGEGVAVKAETTVASYPYSPKPGDSRLERGTVAIEKVAAAAPLSGSSAEVVLTLTGTLPTPCHELRLKLPSAPPVADKLDIEAWSVADPSKMCAQVLQPFSVQVPVSAATQAKIKVNGKSMN